MMIWFPRSQFANWNGPVPTGRPAKSLPSLMYAAWLTTPAAAPANVPINDARGSDIVNLTVRSSTAVTLLTVPKLNLANGYQPSLCAADSSLIWRSKLNRTASALSGVPSWNLMPGRSLNVYSSASFDTVHDEASPGTRSVV